MAVAVRQHVQLVTVSCTVRTAVGRGFACSRAQSSLRGVVFNEDTLSEFFDSVVSHYLPPSNRSEATGRSDKRDSRNPQQAKFAEAVRTGAEVTRARMQLFSPASEPRRPASPSAVYDAV